MQVDCFISLCLWPRERSKSERRGRCSCSVMCWLSAALCQLGAAGFSRRIKPSHGFHSLRTGSCGQGNIYIHSFWPLGSKAQITKSPIVQTTTPRFRGRNPFCGHWDGYDQIWSFSLLHMFQLIISIKLPNSLIPYKNISNWLPAHRQRK